MRRFVLSCLLLLAILPSVAQEFIGCTENGGKDWAETPMLRNTFTVDADDFELRDHDSLGFYVDIVSLGYHEIYVNGKKAPLLLHNGTTTLDYAIQPAVSQLNKRALEVTYNISSLVRIGENEITIWLGQGWGRIYGTPAVAKASVYHSLMSWCQEIVSEKTMTDSTWEASPSGYSYTGNWQPMQFGGERYDARIKPDWRPATVFHADSIAISKQEFSHNRIIDHFEPVSTSLMDDGSILLDFGRVVTGWFDAIFPPTTPAGQEITMEYLDHSDAKPPFTEKDIYIANGSGYEHFTNRFHTHSFRYVRVVGTGSFESHYSASQISAVDPDEGASFFCSDPRLNAIHDMVKYTLSCLTFSGYMVDCPHIERMGYGGDGNSSTMTLQTFWDVRDTYRNWFTAWCDAIDTSGDLPYVAPAFRTGGGPYWCGFIVRAPWLTYLNYGDNYLIREHYKKMRLWLDFIERNCEDGLLNSSSFKKAVTAPSMFRRDPNWCIGDWLAPEGVDVGGESPEFVNNCFLAECLADMEKMARKTFHNADADHYAQWRKTLISNLHKRFYHPESLSYANGTPIDQCYALLLDLPSLAASNPTHSAADATTPPLSSLIHQKLLSDIHTKYRDHIAVGLMGIPIFTEWCIRERQADLMATILRQPDYPGYLHMIDNGATTTWESWSCGREGKEDRSRVHNCYNGIGIWFYQALAGIRPDPTHPGYEHFFIDPQPVQGIDWLCATKPTPHGTIKVEINAEGKQQIAIVVPEGTSATLFPGTSKERLLPPGTWFLPLGKDDK